MLNTRRNNRASAMRRRVEIWAATETRSDTGGVETTWALEATVWAGTSFPRTGNAEVFLADAQTAVTRMIVEIRTRAVDEKKRIRYDGKDYDILSVGESEVDGYIFLTCERRV